MAGSKFLALGILVFVLKTEAATNELTTQLQSRKHLQTTVQAQAESNLYETNSRDFEAEGRLTITPSYKLGQDYRTALSATVLQNFEQGRETRLGNAKLSLSRAPLYITQDTMLIPSAGVRLPTNVEDRKKKTYNGSLLLEPTALTQWNVYRSPFTTVLGLILLKNAHTYDRNATGGANLDYSANFYFGLEKQLLPKLSILLDADYTYARTYQNSLRTLAGFGQSLTYQYNRNLSFTAGHTNAGDALKANGTDYNISVFEGHRSVIYANIRAVF